MVRYLAILALIVSCITVAPAAITNGSFEQPPTSSFVYDPLDPTLGWTFFGRSGVASNTFFVSPAPDGTQVAFIQQYVDQTGSNLSSISQNLSGLSLTSSSLSFSIAQRPGYAPDPIVVSYGSQTLGTVTPSTTAFANVTLNFTPVTSSGTLTFRSSALTTGDLNTAIDNVSLVNAGAAVVPEPATLALVLPALAGLLYFRRRF